MKKGFITSGLGLHAPKHKVCEKLKYTVNSDIFAGILFEINRD